MNPSLYTKANTDDNEQRLNELQVEVVEEIYNTIPYIRIARDAFISMALHCPPTLSLKSLRGIQSPELDLLMEMYWLPWLRDMYDWLKVFGVCPWYFERVEGTDDVIPVVPGMDQGYITTYVNKKHRQKFKWYWTDQPVQNTNVLPEQDRKMYFEHDGSPPSNNGCLRSPMTSSCHA